MAVGITSMMGYIEMYDATARLRQAFERLPEKDNRISRIITMQLI